MGSRFAVCTLVGLTVAVAACNASAVPSASLVAVSSEPSPTSRASAGVLDLDYNCNDNKPCTFAAGTYVLSDANAPDGTLLPGLGFTLNQAWSSREVWLGSVVLDQVAGGGSMVILVDMLPATQDGEPAPDVENQADAIAQWILANPSLQTSDIAVTTLGDGIRALGITVGVSPSWVNLDPDCPVESCSVVLTRPDWQCCFALGLGDHARIYVANIGPSGRPHTLMVILGSVEDGPPMSLAALAAFDASVRPTLDSFVVPNQLVIYCGDTHPAHLC
ncbi:MAG TPA: hypothetical protein VL687_06445 [Methylomirabilota bacterium]|nr:hypothetical protein [Methylomirabilota bacterium]